jgi:hypothetical protein
MVAALVAEQVARPRNVSSLRLLGHAGSPITTDLLRRAHDTFPTAELAQFYGATETASIVTCMPHEERHLEGGRLGSVGQPAVGVEVAVIDGDGQRCAPGVAGEVIVRGPNVMVGYWEDEAATGAAFVDGWYRSGDIGFLDDEHYLSLLDRAKDMIVTGGENVYSLEVEDALGSHPAVLEVAVFGVPDERWVEAVHAVVVVRDASLVTDDLENELRDHCRLAIAGFKVPKGDLDQADPLPKSGPGKILASSPLLGLAQVDQESTVRRRIVVAERGDLQVGDARIAHPVDRLAHCTLVAVTAMPATESSPHVRALPCTRAAVRTSQTPPRPARRLRRRRSSAASGGWRGCEVPAGLPVAQQRARGERSAPPRSGDRPSRSPHRRCACPRRRASSVRPRR